MPMSSRVSSRYSVRASLVAWAAVVAMSLTAALLTWRGSPAIAVLPVLAGALVVAVVVVTRRALRRASARIDAILREELDPPGREAEPRADGGLAARAAHPASERRRPPGSFP